MHVGLRTVLVIRQGSSYFKDDPNLGERHPSGGAGRDTGIVGSADPDCVSYYTARNRVYVLLDTASFI